MRIFYNKNNIIIGVIPERVTSFIPKSELKDAQCIDYDYHHFHLNQYLPKLLEDNKNNLLGQQLIFKEGKLVDVLIKKNLKEDKNYFYGKSYKRTVLINLKEFRVNSDLRRHIKKCENFKFKEIFNFPDSQIDTTKMYPADKYFIDEVKKKGLSNLKFLKVFGVFNEEDLGAMAIIHILSIPVIKLLYWNISNSSYFLIYKLIGYFKKEGFSFLDMGGLTYKNSGINQFKSKFGEVI